MFLVGAGPGDPDLITLRGIRCLQRADVVVYDRLVHPALLEQAPRQAERIFVGKGPGCHLYRQEEITQLLIDLARRGCRVVRLKGGDPYVFGRGAEEGEALGMAGISWEVVPAVTSAVGVPALAGIPVTYRGVAASFAVVTGHRSSEDLAEPNWAALVHVDTLVVLMGVSGLDRIVAELLAHGGRPDTPVAVIQEGTMPGERVLEGTLADVVELARRERVTNPATIVVGEVVRLRHRLGAGISRASERALGRGRAALP